MIKDQSRHQKNKADTGRQPRSGQQGTNASSRHVIMTRAVIMVMIVIMIIPVLNPIMFVVPDRISMRLTSSQVVMINAFFHRFELMLQAC
jgi:hypothetical protein